MRMHTYIPIRASTNAHMMDTHFTYIQTRNTHNYVLNLQFWAYQGRMLATATLFDKCNFHTP